MHWISLDDNLLVDVDDENGMSSMLIVCGGTMLEKNEIKCGQQLIKTTNNYLPMTELLEKHFLEEWSKTWLEQMMQITKTATFRYHYYSIASNPNLTMDVIFSYPKYTWNWTSVSRNPNLTMDVIKKYPHRPWNWLEISKHKNITMEMIEDNPQFQWHWKGIHYNPNLTIDFVLKHPRAKWDWGWIFRNVDIPINMIIDKSTLPSHVYWMFSAGSAMQRYCWNKCVTEDIVENNIDFGWDFGALSYNSNISFEFALKHLDKKWNFRGFAQRVNILHIENNIGLFSSCSGKFDTDIVLNPNLTVDFITKYVTYENWEIIDLAHNPALTQKDLELLCVIFNKPFSIYNFCDNPNMTEQFILEQYEKHCENQFPYGYLKHESITLEFILKNKHLKFHINEYIATKQCNNMRNSMIAHKIQKINLATIYEFHQQPDLYKGGDVVLNVELVFMDCYLMRMIMQK